MIRWGYTACERIRWRCMPCKKTTVWQRPDTAERNHAQGRSGWLSRMQPMVEIAKRMGVHRTSVSRRFKSAPITVRSVPLRPLSKRLVILCDGIKIGYNLVVLIAYEVISGQPLRWAFVPRERFDTWQWFLLPIAQRHDVYAVVSDGQKGLKKALLGLFPHAWHQRCMAHVMRLALAWLTKNPQSSAGKELRMLVLSMTRCITQHDARVWRRSFANWQEAHDTFLCEKSANPKTGRGWYTHKKLRAVRSLIANALSNLFRYTERKRIPRTTNDLEGGINSPLRERLGRHRGITLIQKVILVSEYLYRRRI